MSRDSDVRFDADGRVVAAFVAALTALAVASNLVSAPVRQLGFAASIVHGGIWAASLVLVTEWVLRREGKSLGLLLPDRRRAAAALVAFLGFVLLLNGVQVLLGLWYDVPLQAGAMVTRPVLAVGVLAVEFVFTGLPEELAFRGYLQSRVVHAAPVGTFWRVAAVIFASAIFAAWHLPDRLIGLRLGPVATAWSLGWVFVHALFVFALVYALTRNVALAGLVHAFLNEGRFLVALGGPHGFVTGWWTVAVVVAAVVVSLSYRRWLVLATGSRPALRSRSVETQ